MNQPSGGGIPTQVCIEWGRERKFRLVRSDRVDIHQDALLEDFRHDFARHMGECVESGNYADALEY